MSVVVKGNLKLMGITKLCSTYNVNEKDNLQEVTYTYSPDGGKKSVSCSAVFEKCQTSFAGKLKDEGGRITYDFNGYYNTAMLTHISYSETGLIESQVTEDGVLEGLEAMTELPTDLEKRWKKDRLDREENFKYEFFE